MGKKSIKKKVRDLIVEWNWFITGDSGFSANFITTIHKDNRQSALRTLRKLKKEFEIEFPDKKAYKVDSSYNDIEGNIYRISIPFCDWLEAHYKEK